MHINLASWRECRRRVVDSVNPPTIRTRSLAYMQDQTATVITKGPTLRDLGLAMSSSPFTESTALAAKQGLNHF